jgi:hypothetical protein
MLIMEDEVVSESQSVIEGSSLYKLSATSNMIVMIIRNSIFANNHNRLINSDHVTVYIHGCIFTDNLFEATSNVTLNLSREMNNLTYALV